MWRHYCMCNRWSDSQLKAFLDRLAIPNPSPRTRDSLLAAAHDSYQAVADKLGENYAYPGNWLYESWSESDLKSGFLSNDNNSMAG